MQLIILRNTEQIGYRKAPTKKWCKIDRILLLPQVSVLALVPGLDSVEEDVRWHQLRRPNHFQQVLDKKAMKCNRCYSFHPLFMVSIGSVLFFTLIGSVTSTINPHIRLWVVSVSVFP